MQKRRPDDACSIACAKSPAICGHGSVKARRFDVCGDALRMAKDVEFVSTEIVAQMTAARPPKRPSSLPI